MLTSIYQTDLVPTIDSMRARVWSSPWILSS